MSIEDRVRRVLADAVANEPPLRGAPLEAIPHRQRRSQSVLAGAFAMALILGAVVAFAVVRGPGRGPVAPTPTPSTVASPPTPSTTRPARTAHTRAHHGREDVPRRRQKPPLPLPAGVGGPSPPRRRRRRACPAPG